MEGSAAATGPPGGSQWQTHDPLQGHPTYEALRTLGRGSHSFVQLARHKQLGELVAVKFIHRGWEPRQTKYVGRELLIHQELTRSRHPHVVEFREAFLTPMYLAVVMEYVDGEDLQQFLTNTGGRVTEALARFLFQQIVLALDFIHRKGKVSRDVKLANTLLALAPNQLPLVKLCDFGFAKDVMVHSRPISQVGTALFVSPEVMRNFKGAAYDGALADVWSCGVVLFILLFGRHPFLLPDDAKLPQHQQMLQLFARTERSSFELSSEERGAISAECADMLTKLLQKQPAQRINMSGIQVHPFFTNGLPEGAAVMNSLVLREEHTAGYRQQPQELQALVQAAERVDLNAMSMRWDAGAGGLAPSAGSPAWTGPAPAAQGVALPPAAPLQPQLSSNQGELGGSCGVAALQPPQVMHDAFGPLTLGQAPQVSALQYGGVSGYIPSPTSSQLSDMQQQQQQAQVQQANPQLALQQQHQQMVLQQQQQQQQVALQQQQQQQQMDLQQQQQMALQQQQVSLQQHAHTQPPPALQRDAPLFPTNLPPTPSSSGAGGVTSSYSAAACGPQPTGSYTSRAVLGGEHQDALAMGLAGMQLQQQAAAGSSAPPPGAQPGSGAAAMGRLYTADLDAVFDGDARGLRDAFASITSLPMLPSTGLVALTSADLHGLLGSQTLGALSGAPQAAAASPEGATSAGGVSTSATAGSPGGSASHSTAAPAGQRVPQPQQLLNMRQQLAAHLATSEQQQQHGASNGVHDFAEFMVADEDMPACRVSSASIDLRLLSDMLLRPNSGSALLEGSLWHKICRDISFRGQPTPEGLRDMSITK